MVAWGCGGAARPPRALPVGGAARRREQQRCRRRRLGVALYAAFRARGPLLRRRRRPRCAPTAGPAAILARRRRAVRLLHHRPVHGARRSRPAHRRRALPGHLAARHDGARLDGSRPKPRRLQPTIDWRSRSRRTPSSTTTRRRARSACPPRCGDLGAALAHFFLAPSAHVLGTAGPPSNGSGSSGAGGFCMLVGSDGAPGRAGSCPPARQKRGRGCAPGFQRTSAGTRLTPLHGTTRWRTNALAADSGDAHQPTNGVELQFGRPKGARRSRDRLGRRRRPRSTCSRSARSSSTSPKPRRRRRR